MPIFLGRTIRALQLPILAMLLGGLLTLGGCSNPSGNSAKETTLWLGQFPSDLASYHIYVDFWNGSEFISEADLGLSVASGMELDHFSLPTGTTKFGIFLLEPTNLSGSPRYFDSHGVTSDSSSYGSYYWLDYDDYFNSSPRIFRYGISEQAGLTMTNLADLSVDFDKAPYYLFKYANTDGSLITAEYSSTGKGIWTYFGSTLADAIKWQPDTWAGTYLTTGTLRSTTSPVYLVMQPSNFTDSTTAKISFTETNRLALDDTVTCLVATDKPDVIYAVTTSSHSLYEVNPTAKTATLLCKLPLSNVKGVVYSSPDKKLYGYTSDSGKLVVYDIATQSTQTITYASAYFGTGIAISPSERRLYLCAGERADNGYGGNRDLFILDQDTLQVITSGYLDYSEGGIAYSPSEKAIFCSSSFEIDKRSVKNDVIGATRTRYSGAGYSRYHDFAVNHAGTQLAFGTADGGYAVKTINTKTMEVDLSWKVENYPRRAVYSQDDKYVFASIEDSNSAANGKLSKATASDLSPVSSYIFPATYFVVNSDSSKAIGFSDTEKAFYFVDVSDKTAAAKLTSGSVLAQRERPVFVDGAAEFSPRAGR